MPLLPIVLIGVLLMADGGLALGEYGLALHGPAALVAALGPVLVTVALAFGATAWCHHRLVARGATSAIVWAQRIARLARWVLLAHFAVIVLGLGWLETVRSVTGDLVLVDEIVAMLATVAGVIAIWWIAYPMERRLREAVLLRQLDRGHPVFAVPRRGEYVVTQTRLHLLFMLVPMLAILAAAESIDAAAARFADVAWVAPAADVATVLVAAAVVLAAPFLCRLVLEVEPLARSDLRDELLEVCRVHSVTVRELLVWKTHGVMVNAAVMGFIGRLRYVLLTDALLESLSRQQV